LILRVEQRIITGMGIDCNVSEETVFLSFSTYVARIFPGDLFPFQESNLVRKNGLLHRMSFLRITS